MGNRHPVDELAEIRAERRRLELRELALRNRILRGDVDLDGDDYRAKVASFERAYLDRAKLEQRFGRAAVAECTRTVGYQVISLSRRKRTRTTKLADAAEVP
jgi:hypothetical protein